MNLRLPSILLLAVLPACSSSTTSTTPTQDSGASVHDSGASVQDSGSGQDSAQATDSGSSQDSTAQGTDSGTSITDGASGDAGACNTLANSGAPVQLMTSGAEPPSGTGGTVVNGTYTLTSIVLYDGLQDAGMSPAASLTISISGDTVQSIASTSGQPAVVETSTFTTSGTSFTLTQTCPGGGNVQTGTFTATATMLTLFTAGAGSSPSEVVTFTMH